MITVKFTSNLKSFFPRLSEFSTEKNSLQALIDEIENKYPGIKAYLLDDQNTVRKHVNIFINGKSISDKHLLKDTLSAGDEVYFMQALSGG